MDPNVQYILLEVSLQTNLIDLTFCGLEIFEVQPKFHLVFQQLSPELEILLLFLNT